MQADFSTVKEQLVNDEDFITKVCRRVQEGSKIVLQGDALEEIIEEISELLETLIKKKMEQQLWVLIEDNNRILEQIKHNLNKSHSNILQPNLEIENSNHFHQNSFSDIHNIIIEQKRKALDCMNDAEVEKSLSVLQKYEDVIEKVNALQKKVKAMQDRYQTNFKSLWNVLSMTQAAVFDHIKQNKGNKKLPDTVKEPQKAGNSFFPFWK